MYVQRNECQSVLCTAVSKRVVGVRSTPPTAFRNPSFDVVDVMSMLQHMNSIVVRVE